MKTFKQFMQESQLGGPLPRIKKPVEIQTITRSIKDDGKEFPYREVLPKKGIYHNTPVAPTVLPKKKDKPVWKNKEFQYPGMPIKDLLGGGTTL